jgi:peptidylprolyl isomerase
MFIASCGSEGSSNTTEAILASDPADSRVEPKVSLPDEIPAELVITDITEGTGAGAVSGDTVFVYYVGVLSEDGTRFDGNFDAEPFAVTLGAGAVIDGWDQGLIGIKTGGRRQLDIPSDLAYGPMGSGGAIPPDSAISFIVDAVAIVPAVDPADEPKITIEGSANITETVSEDLVVGEGNEAIVDANVLVNIIAYRADTGELLVSTWGDPTPVAFALSEDVTLPGLAQGVAGMKVGGRRQIAIPFIDAFGPDGNEEMGLPPSTDLIVIVDLLATF